MADSEKVIKGLENEINRANFFDLDYLDCVESELLRDALALLKAQEAKLVVIKENLYGWKFFYCPSCGREFYADSQHGCVNEAKFCDKCGQAVKWDG